MHAPGQDSACRIGMPNRERFVKKRHHAFGSRAPQCVDVSSRDWQVESRRGSGKRGKISNHLKKKPAIGAVLHIPNTSKDQSLVIATHRAA